MQQLQVGKLDNFIIVRPKPATMVSGVDYILECLLPLIQQTHDADDSVGTFDRIVLQACVPGSYFFVQCVELFFVKCKLRNISFPSKQMAIIAITTVVIVVVITVTIVAFNIGINNVTATSYDALDWGCIQHG
jgi:hypothetical protein